MNKYSIAVILPCYRTKENVLNVLNNIPDDVQHIYCIDDACDQGTGQHIVDHIKDERVKVIFHDKNQGVGAAMVTGYKAALKDGSDVIVKIDSDGQMDPRLLHNFTKPIVLHKADYTKGNRFYTLENLEKMPRIRLFGNAILSFFSKISTGYWRMFDPNNGYTAIHSRVLALLPLDKISKRYFFESDLLFRLNIIGAVVLDVPMEAKYNNEKSNLSILFSVIEFGYKHTINFIKRIFYNYFLRDFHVASLEILIGPLLMLYGFLFGMDKWYISVTTGLHATAGQVMNAALPMIVGLQLTLSALNFDMKNKTSPPLHTLVGEE